MGRRWLWSLAAAWIFAALLAAFMTGWNWLDNPSEIFHGPSGTHWTFLYDTFESWFVPVFFYSTLVLLGARAVCWLRSRFQPGP